MTVLDAPTRPELAYDLDGGRCAVEVMMTIASVPLWRVRLRIVTARLEPADDDRSGRLVAHAAVSSQFASLPFARRWFLPRSGRSDLATFTVPNLPALAEGDRFDATATVVIGDRTWPVNLAVRTIEVGDHLVVAARGPVQRPIADSLPSTSVYLDIAAELRPCA